MWNKRKEDEVVPKPATPPISPATAREGNPVSHLPGRTSEPEMPRAVANIGKSVVIKGQVNSREDLFVDGEVEGTLELLEHRLTIGPHARIGASVKAREVVIMGQIKGDIEAADKIDIRKEAKLVGDIRTARIVIEDGAYFKGSVDIQRPEASRPAVAAKPQPPSAAAGSAQQTPLQRPLTVNSLDTKS
jgi:cytoskeletal protein CcmA (bactofilin family)